MRNPGFLSTLKELHHVTRMGPECSKVGFIISDLLYFIQERTSMQASHLIASSTTSLAGSWDGIKIPEPTSKPLLWKAGPKQTPSWVEVSGCPEVGWPAMIKGACSSRPATATLLSFMEYLFPVISPLQPWRRLLYTCVLAMTVL